MKKIELLAPAGNLDKLKMAIRYGADAVYIGGKSFSLRARASNFSLEDIREACAFAATHQAKIYVTMNIVPHQEDFTGLDEYLLYLHEVGVRAIITSSVSIMERSLALVPKMEVHLSTQLSIANHLSCNYYQEQGVSRIVLARELDLSQLHSLRQATSVGLEVFIHGGMCSSYSGRCMLSNHLVNRDANRGGCAHSCRWDYHLYHHQQLIHEAPFKIASKDLCGVEAIPQLIEMGIDSLKIEGRMKSEYYIATVVRAYRKLLDACQEGRPVAMDEIYQELAKAENRPFSTGFLIHEPTHEGHLYAETSTPTKEFVGMVLDWDEATQVAKLEQRNHFPCEAQLEFFGPHLDNTLVSIHEIWDQEGNQLDAARHPKQVLFVRVPFKVSPYDMVRLVKAE